MWEGKTQRSGEAESMAVRPNQTGVQGAEALDYIAHIDQQIPDFYPGITAWSDEYGSCGSYPADDGRGATIMRLRVPAPLLPSWFDEHLPLYRTWPFVRVTPRETPGLVPWLNEHGYAVATREALLVKDLPVPRDLRPKAASAVHRVRSLRALAQVTVLDTLVFPEDPPLSPAALRRELARLRSGSRQLYCVEGPSNCALAAARLNIHDGWAYLCDGATHPDHRHQGLYRSLVAIRLQAATRHGAQFVAVHANLKTSAPILLHLGFREVEQQEVYRPPQKKLSLDLTDTDS